MHCYGDKTLALCIMLYEIMSENLAVDAYYYVLVLHPIINYVSHGTNNVLLQDFKHRRHCYVRQVIIEGISYQTTF